MQVETAFDGSKNSLKPSEEDSDYHSSNYSNDKSHNQKGHENRGSASKNSIIYLTIKPDQGGKEARDFCSIMLRMLVRYASDKNVTCEIIDDGEYEIVLRISDTYDNWGWLNGFHKIVRVSPFSKGDKIHTSLCRIAVSNPKKKLNLVLNDSDLRYDFFKSTGAGGQHRNKTMSAVRITHLPTKIFSVSAAERSQYSNKDFALEQLIEKLKDYEDNLEKINSDKRRQEILSKKETVLSFYYNHKLVVNEKGGKRSTQIKDILNGNLDLVK